MSAGGHLIRRAMLNRKVGDKATMFTAIKAAKREDVLK